MNFLIRSIALFIFLLIAQTAYSQVHTFNKRLYLGQRTMVLGALHTTDTAYYAAGITVDTVTPGMNTAALFLKLDTLGNPLDMKIIADSNRT